MHWTWPLPSPDPQPGACPVGGRNKADRSGRVRISRGPVAGQPDGHRGVISGSDALLAGAAASRWDCDTGRGSAASSSWKESWGRHVGSTIPSAGSKPEGHSGFHAAWAGGGAVCGIGAPGRRGGAQDPLLHLSAWIWDKCTSLRSQFPRSVNGAGDPGHEEMPTAGHPAARWPWSSTTWPCSPQHRVPAQPLSGLEPRPVLQLF